MRQNSDYHYSGALREFYMCGWTFDLFEGPDTPNVSLAGLFTVNLCRLFEDRSNHLIRLGSPAAESENQFVVYIYISVENRKRLK